MCEYGHTKKVRVLSGKGNWVLKDIDECIVPLIQTLNRFGIRTLNSCCGHGKTPGEIVISGENLHMWGHLDGTFTFALQCRTPKGTICSHPSFAIVNMGRVDEEDDEDYYSVFCWKCGATIGFSFFTKEEWEEQKKQIEEIEKDVHTA